MTTKLEELQAQVARTTEIEQSAITLLQGLHDLLEQAKTDPAKLEELSGQLATSSEALAAAIVENTPVEVPNSAGGNTI